VLRLSALLRGRVEDGSGQRRKLADLAVDLSTGDYPVVTHLLVPGPDDSLLAQGGPFIVTPAGTLRVPKLVDGSPVDPDDLAQRVRLGRDVLDALVLDLGGERAVRANDLWLRETPDGLELAGADISPWAVIRRLSRGRIGRGTEADILDWRDVEFLRGDPQAAAAGRDYHRRLTRLTPVQLARLTDALPYLHAAELLLLLPDPQAADVLEHMLPERQAQVIVELEPQAAARILAEAAPDEAADVLGRLELSDATRLLEELPPERLEPVQALLRFPPDSAGGIMTNDVVTAPADVTVGQVLDHIRPQLGRPDFVYFLYLVADCESQRLVGVTTLRDLTVADPDTPVARIMRAALVTVGPLETALAAARVVADEGLNAVPVVAADGRLLGIITVDKAMREILPDSWRDSLPRVFS
jgi:magnesium transporter